MMELNMWSFLVVYLLQVLGAFDHWRLMKKGYRIRGSFFDYLFGAYPGRTIGTYAALLASAWASCEAGVADNLNPELLFGLFNHLIETGNITMKTAITIITAAGLSVTTGYGFDSRFNKGATLQSESTDKEK